MDSVIASGAGQPYLLTFKSTNMVAKTRQKAQATKTGSGTLAERLSRNIANGRHALGLTQAQLAERLNVDTETLSRFERGKHLPSLVTLEKLAAQLQTTIAALLEEAEPQADSDALAMTAWLMALDQRDRNFVREQLRQTCHHLEERNTRR